MDIKLSALPPELQRRLLQEMGPRTAAAGPRRPAPAKKQPSRLMRVCSCRFEIFRPDGDYPEHCDGCGKKWLD